MGSRRYIVSAMSRCTPARPRSGLICSVMKFGSEYVDKRMTAYETIYRQPALNLQLVPPPEVTG